MFDNARTDRRKTDFPVSQRRSSGWETVGDERRERRPRKSWRKLGANSHGMLHCFPMAVVTRFWNDPLDFLYRAEQSFYIRPAKRYFYTCDGSRADNSFKSTVQNFVIKALQDATAVSRENLSALHSRNLRGTYPCSLIFMILFSNFISQSNCRFLHCIHEIPIFLLGLHHFEVSRNI